VADVKARLAEVQRLAADARVRLEENLAELASVRSQLSALGGGGPAAPARGALGESSPALSVGALPADAQHTGEAELLLDDLGPAPEGGQKA